MYSNKTFLNNRSINDNQFFLQMKYFITTFYQNTVGNVFSFPSAVLNIRMYKIAENRKVSRKNRNSSSENKRVQFKK